MSNTQTVSEILTLTNYVFIKPKSLQQTLGNMFPKEYEEFCKDMNKFENEIIEANSNTSIKKPRFNANRLYGYYFTVTFKDGTTMYSTLYADEGTTTYARDCLLRKINRIVADLERITI